MLIYKKILKYYKQKMTVEVIARKINKSRSYVRSVLNAHGLIPHININYWEEKRAEREKISQLYREGHKVKELMKMFNKSKSTINRSINLTGGFRHLITLPRHNNIYKDHTNGSSLKELAKKYGYDEDYIREIIKKQFYAKTST